MSRPDNLRSTLSLHQAGATLVAVEPLDAAATIGVRLPRLARAVWVGSGPFLGLRFV